MITVRSESQSFVSGNLPTFSHILNCQCNACDVGSGYDSSQIARLEGCCIEPLSVANRISDVTHPNDLQYVVCVALNDGASLI